MTLPTLSVATAEKPKFFTLQCVAGTAVITLSHFVNSASQTFSGVRKLLNCASQKPLRHIDSIPRCSVKDRQRKEAVSRQNLPRKILKILKEVYHNLNARAKALYIQFLTSPIFYRLRICPSVTSLGKIWDIFCWVKRGEGTK